MARHYANDATIITFQQKLYTRQKPNICWEWKQNFSDKIISDNNANFLEAKESYRMDDFNLGIIDRENVRFLLSTAKGSKTNTKYCICVDVLTKICVNRTIR